MRSLAMYEESDPPSTGARRHDLRRVGTAALVLPTIDTGRDGFVVRIERCIADSRRRREQISVLSIAVDGVTTMEGQVAGAALRDSVDSEIGHRLRSRVRSTDEVLHTGELEFGVILPNTGRDGALVVQARLSQVLGGLYRLGPDLVAVTLNIGFASFPAAGQGGAALLAAAIDARGP
jgi:diguanylate cyclase (GGDEF)-like protein